MTAEIDLVRAQYEQWVFPLPVENLAGAGKQMSDPGVMSLSYWPARPQRTGLDILVAGCGTREAAVLAMHNPDSSIVGIDISEASLSHSRALKDRHGLSNLTLRQVSIEDVATLGKSFDFVTSYGVLHHLRDPLAGLKALAAVLREDGVMFLMLYAYYGRAGIYVMQEFFRLLGLAQSKEDVDLVRHTLGKVRNDHPAKRFASTKDWQFDAGVVDLFLHPRDRPYTVAQCVELIESAALTIQGWGDQYYYYPDAYLPHDSELYQRIDRLPERQIWQAMELFHGQLIKHHLYVCHARRDPGSYKVSFDDPSLMDRVPVLLEDARRSRDASGRVVMERPGIGTVAFGEPHASVVGAIDGRRTIRECVRSGMNRSPGAESAIGRSVFRQLWRVGFAHLAIRPAR